MTAHKTSHKHKFLLVILGIFLTVILLEVSLRLAGFLLLKEGEYLNISRSHHGNVYRIMCLGESTTMFGGMDSYPRQLERILNERSTTKEFQVINKGVPGTNSAVILSELEHNLNIYRPDMVITMIGINDTKETPIYKDSPLVKLKLFLRDFRVYKLFKFIKCIIVKKSNQTDNAVFKEDISRPEEINAFTEENLKNEIKLHPKNEWAYFELGELYRKAERFHEAGELFRNGIKFSPHELWAFRELGQNLIAQGKFNEVEGLYHKAIQINPRKPWAYNLLAHFLMDQNKYQEAQDVLEESIRKNPFNYKSRIDLGQFYRTTKNFKKSKEIFQAAIKSYPQHAILFKELGYCYVEAGDYVSLDKMFDQAARLEGPRVFIELSEWYFGRSKFPEAEAVLKKAAAMDPHDQRLYRALASYYDRRGMMGLSNKYVDIADETALKYTISARDKNYQEIVKVIKKHGKKIVCAQYPVRDVKLLMKRLEPVSEGIIFVDNEQIFKDAIKKGKYEDYFTDEFAGDFGHGTAKGNRLLAENIANAVLENL